MIKSARHVVTASYSREILPLTDVSESISDKTETMSLPFEFGYNGNWKVNHKCSKCGANCLLAHDIDKKNFPYYFYNFHQSKFLCDKYYKVEVLKELDRVLNLSELKEINDKFYLTKLGLIDLRFPVISSIKLAYSECSNCGSEFFVQIENYAPLPREKNDSAGKNGLVVINDIIHVEFESKLSFSQFLNDDFLRKKDNT